MLVHTPTSTLPAHPPLSPFLLLGSCCNKEDCWCVINLFKRRKKSKTKNFVSTKAYFNFILLFSSLEIKPLGMFFFWKHVSEVHFSSKRAAPSSPVNGAVAMLVSGSARAREAGL